MEELKRLSDIYLAASLLSPRSSFDAYQSWMDLRKRCLDPFRKEHKNFKLLFQLLKVAALLLIVVTLGILAFRYLTVRENPVSTYSEYNVPRGSRSHIFLPDGTSVWLNAQSSLKYDQSFGKKTREVLLEGEAYFEVVRNETLPFLVKASKTIVRVLGTSFNVKAYPDENFIETTVIQGKVKVLSPEIKNPEREFTLIANQKIRILTEATGKAKDTAEPSANHISPAQNPLLPEREKVDFSPMVSANVYASWKDSLWIIERESLKDLAVMIARRYNVEVEFRDAALEQYIFSGKLKDESLQQVLQAISTAAPIEFVIHQNSITFREKTKKQ
jgi:ferric-dicitrate binding protein FerR (iron transport regulator)